MEKHIALVRKSDQRVESILNNHEVMYGGMKKASDSPEWFCIKCLEDIYL